MMQPISVGKTQQLERLLAVAVETWGCFHILVDQEIEKDECCCPSGFSLLLFQVFFLLIISVSLTVSVYLSSLCVYVCVKVWVCVYMCVWERRHMPQHKCEGKRTLKSWLFPSTVGSNSTGLCGKCFNQVIHLDSQYFPFIHSETLTHLRCVFLLQLNLPEIVLTSRGMPLLP